MHSLITPLFEAQAITAVDTEGASVFPQRLSDESGAIQVTLNQDPGSPPVGYLTIEGRLRPDLGWAPILNIDLTDADLNATPFSTIEAAVQVVPEMRVATRTNSGYSVAADTTATVLLME